jgi:methionyl-tRNA formyltransferase
MEQVVVLTKCDAWCQRAGQLAQIVFGDRLCWVQGSVGDPFPSQSVHPKPDYLISFLSPWIVPKQVLETAKVAINFHPASCDYPGIGCYNFCLYEGASYYGATCHHMVEKVDRGKIIEERRFRVLENETVETLKFRTMIVMLSLYHDILIDIAAGKPMPAASASWSRRPFTRTQLNELCSISPDMADEEIARRVRATVYPGRPGPTVNIGGTEFRYGVPNREPLA